MNRLTHTLIFALGGALLSAIASVHADELTVDRYVELSMARLQLAKDTYEREKRVLTPEEEKGLYAQYSTTAEDFVAYRSGHPAEVEGYLAAHPDLSVQIDTLSTQFRELVTQEETP